MKKQWYTDPIIFCVFASWAVAFVFIKMALSGDGGFSPLAFLWPRMFLSALIMFALLPLIRQPVHVPRKHIGKTIMIGVVGLGSYHLLFTIALSMTTPVDTALIIGTGPVMTALWMPLFGMPKPKRRAWVGITLCFATVATIALYGAGEHPTAKQKWDTERLLGDLIMLVSSNCWALNGILCRRAVPYLKPTTITAWGMLWASAALLPVCLYSMCTQDWMAITPGKWACFFYAVMPASTLSVVFFYFGVKKVGPLHTIIYQNASPVITALFVCFLTRFEETPNVAQIAGLFLIFLGVYLTRTSKPRVPDEPLDP